MKIKNFIRVLLSVVLVFGFSSAWAKTIKWSMQGDSLTLDPHAQNEGPTTQVSRQVYEALVQRGLDMKIGPALATSWKATDPNTWIFTLREDVKFSDGSKMTSADVIPDPSENLASSLKVKIQVLGSVAFHFVANAGPIFISRPL